jgi:hypothetical protein
MFLAHLETYNAPESVRSLWQGTGEGDAGGVWAIDYPDETV